MSAMYYARLIMTSSPSLYKNMCLLCCVTVRVIDFVGRRVEDADVGSITALFFLLVLLAATQDIAVDGWALTLLARNNVG